MNIVLLAVCALVAMAFLWRQYGAGAEEKAFRQAGSAVKFFVTVLALLPIVMLLVSLWNVVTPYSYRIMVDSFDNYRTSEPTPTIQVAPAKNTGEPLQWGAATKAKVRERVRNESVDERGIAFVGCIPPHSWMELRTDCGRSGGNWEAFVVEQSASGFLSSDVLKARAVSQHNVRTTAAIRLGGLKPSATGSTDARILDNLSGGSAADPGVLVVDYVQITGPGVSILSMDRQEPEGVIQYLVDVGRDGASFTLLHQNWKWLWIAPVHCSGYQSRLNSKSVPAEGIPIAEAANYMGVNDADLEKALNAHPMYLSRISCQALMVKKGNEEFQTFHQSTLWQPKDFKVGETVELRLNIPPSGSVWGEIKPATIIVGIQQ